jgi:hypothetical protein
MRGNALAVVEDFDRARRDARPDLLTQQLVRHRVVVLVDQMRRREQKTDPALKGFRWALLKDRSKLSREQAMDLDRLVIQFTTKRTARAWLYREQLRNILDRKQITSSPSIVGYRLSRHPFA